MFFDRKGFYKDSLGKNAAAIAEELDDFYKKIIDLASQNRGEVVKFMGDAGLLLFDETDDAVRFSRELLGMKAYDSNVGIAAGEVVKGRFGKPPLEWEDVIGEPVNQAAKNMQRSASSGKPVVLDPSAWLELALEDKSGLARSDEV